jgi:hypothetical protein
MWFLNLPFDKSIDNTKTQSLNFEFKTQEAQLEDQKPKKIFRKSSRRRKSRKANKMHEKRQNQRNSKKISKTQKLTKLPSEINST